MKKQFQWLALVLLFFMLCTVNFVPPAGAKDTFPSKPITWIVPMSPGGGFDVYSRGVSKFMEKYLGQPFVIKNVPGAGNRTGTNAIYRARPDGYTIGIINMPGMVASQMLMKTQFDLDKFTWLGGVADEKYVLATGSKTPFRTLKDLQESKTPLNIGSTGRGSTSNAVTVIGSKMMNIPFNFVSGYAGSTETVVATIRGDCALVNFITTSIYSYIESGDLRPVLQYSKQRHPLYPDTPTVVELGFPKLAVLSLPRLIAAPPKVPQDRAAMLESALIKALKDPELISWAKKSKRDIDVITGTEAAELVRENINLYKQYEEVLKTYY
jgi:tripartite-type tricarboxylate transporter receptor subunit TctC